MQIRGADFLSRRPVGIEARPMAELSVEVQGTSIIVTMPGTDLSVTYQKRFAAPHFVLTQRWVPAHVPWPTIFEFRTRAFQAAVAKARELGWIRARPARFCGLPPSTLLPNRAPAEASP